jgi:hypothetical protein
VKEKETISHMPTSGTTFTDWEQVEADRRRPLLVDEDFSWSEPPSRRRRSVASEAKPERRRRVEPEYDAELTYAGAEPTYVATEPAYAAEPVYGVGAIDVEREIDTAWGGRLSASAADTYEVVPGDAALEPSGRRTVVITGRGAGHYSISRRHAEAGLAFHERSGFNPDRMAMWAVLLGIALLLGCIAH